MLDQTDVLGALKPTLKLMTDAVLVTESDLAPPGPRIVFVNRAFTTLTGYAANEILGKTPRILYGEKTDRAVFDRLVRDLKAHGQFRAEAVLYRKDGSELTLDWQIVPLLETDGGVRYRLKIQRDTSGWEDVVVGQRTADEMCRNLVKNHPDLICRFLPDTTLAFVNSAYARFFELDRRDLVGKRFLEFLADEDDDRVSRHLASVTPDKPAIQYEHKTESADGSVHWHLWNDLATFDDDGNVLFFQSVGTDITERKKAEDALRESEERIRTITDSLPSRIAYVDKEERYRFNNKTYETCFGVPRERIYGKHVKDLIGARNYKKVKPHIINVLSGKTVRFEYRNAHQHKQTFEDIIYIPDFDLNGSVKGFYVLINDITDRKRVEIELRRSKEFLDNVLDAIDDPVFVKDEDHRWVVLNKKACELIGGSRSDLIGGNDYDYFSDGHASFSWDTDDEVLKHQRTIQYCEKIRLNGRIHTFSTKKGLFTDSATGSRYVAGTNRDITELAEAREALFKEKERAEVTLHSISDAVITTDAKGRVEFLNPVAVALTGWTMEDAQGKPLPTICRLIDEQTREPMADLVAQCLTTGETIGPADHSILIHRGGREFAVEESAAPMRSRDGEVPGVVLVLHDVTDTRRMAKQMAHDAAHDPLTELVNRREFERRLDRAFGSAKQYGSRHALCYIDLDQFKIINDTAGHAAGDELLKQVRDLLTGKFRERDTLARLGGDEFALLLDNCALEEAIKISEVVIAAFREHRFEWKGRTFQVGASIGLVPVTAEAESPAEILAQADVACYTAKERGRNRVHVYQGEGSEPSRRHSEIHLAVNLRDALEQERFRLYYQPIVSLSSHPGPSVRYEVLLRMLDTDGALRPPREFIPAAERYGLMPAIDRWVIRTAFRRYNQQFAHLPDAEISINLSGTSLSDDSLLGYVRKQFDTFSVPPANVCFEITETAAIQNLGHAVDFIAGVKKHGSRLALDDFGSGLSSFKYLKTLPADYLKIDGGFVRDMLDDPVDHAMVEAINEVGHIMGIKTIAEYVHTQAIMDRLTVIGVDCAQGYAIGEPTPLN